MDRRRHRAGGAAAWRILRHRRTADARPWPPSRPGARRRRQADAPVAAARQQRARGVAGAARRASRLLRDRGHAAARGHRAGVVACGLWRDPSGLAGAAVAGARSARGHLRDARPHAGRFRRHRRSRGASDQVRTGDAGRTRLRARSGKLRRDRGDHRADLRVAEIRRRGVAGGRRSLARPAAAAAGVPARRRRRPERLVGPGPAGRLCAHRIIPAAPRAGTARAGPFRRPRRVYQRGDQISGEGRRFRERAFARPQIAR